MGWKYGRGCPDPSARGAFAAETLPPASPASVAGTEYFLEGRLRQGSDMAGQRAGYSIFMDRRSEDVDFRLFGGQSRALRSSPGLVFTVQTAPRIFSGPLTLAHSFFPETPMDRRCARCVAAGAEFLGSDLMRMD